jgi:putative ABC transport system permease protein
MVPVTYNIRNLIERKATTLMTALGIALTVAVLVTSVALGTGLSAVFNQTGEPHHFLVLRQGTDAELMSSISRNLYETVRTLPGIARDATGEPLVSPESLSVVSLPNRDDPEVGMNVTVRGLKPVGLAMRSQFRMVDGRAFTPGLREVIVGESIAKRYPDAKIGNQLRFGSGTWTVVGVFAVGDSAANSEMWVDQGQFNGDYNRAGESSSILVGVDEVARIEELKQRVESDKSLGGHVISETAYYKAQSTSNITALFLQGIGYSVAIIMAVGSAFAATNTMYAAVIRRTKEIGTLRALGFGRWSILLSFMLESVFLSLMGGVLGVLMALPLNGMAQGIGNFNTFSDITFKFQVGPLAIALGLVFAACIGAFGGLLPAWSASRKEIVQAMRDV